MRYLTLILACFLFLAPCVKAAENMVVPAKLSSKDQSDLQRVEDCLNQLKSVAAGFIQVNDNGEFRHGKIAIQRPGKMRVTYDAPSKDFIVADGSFVNIWDDQLGNQTSLPIGSSIAEFILRDNVKLSGDVTVTHMAHYPAKIEVSLVATKDPGQGELTLVFEDKPLQLREWRVLDPQGRLTTVTLESPREGASFPEGTFTFVSPKFGKSGRN